MEYVLASELAIDSQNCITGKLQGKNCWGEEKVAQLNELFGSKDNYILYAYGNSRGDKELLELADYPFYRTFE
jgi:phosphoserine phosphatase